MQGVGRGGGTDGGLRLRGPCAASEVSAPRAPQKMLGTNTHCKSHVKTKTHHTKKIQNSKLEIQKFKI